MKLDCLDSLQLQGKKVFLRAGLDVPIKDGQIQDDTRLSFALSAASSIRQKQASKIIIAGHIGRPKAFEKDLSTLNLIDWLKSKLGEDVYYLPFREDVNAYSEAIDESEHRYYLMENLRFWPGEEACDETFVKSLATLADFYINESFEVSHRRHASLVGLPGLLPCGWGMRFCKEIKTLDDVLENPKRPAVLVLSGKKRDKLEYLESFLEIFDKVLIGGRLPEYIGEDVSHPKILLARLMPDKEDITLNSVEKFEKVLFAAKTIVVSGPLGKFEEEGHSQGTVRVLQAIAENNTAFRVAGGGDTNAAIKKFGFHDKFDWISSGGGAMLTYLAQKTLPVFEP